nr:odorant receptor [Semanotus bifasciatus]
MISKKMLEEFSKKYAPKDYYIWEEVFLKLLGLFPPQDKKKKFLQILLALPNIFLCVPLLSFLECYTLARDIQKDFMTNMLNMYVVIVGMIMLVRIFIWFLERNKFLEIRSIVQREGFEFRCFSIQNVKNSDTFNIAKRRARHGVILQYEDIQKLWGTVQVTLSEERNKVDVYRENIMAQIRMLSCCLHLLTNIAAVGIYIASYIVVEPILVFNEEYNVTLITRTYATMVDLNFEIPLLKEHGCLLKFYQVYSTCARVTIFVPVMTFVTVTILHLIGQTMTVGKAFRCVDKNLDHKIDPDTVLLIKEIRIVKCVTELQQIYRAMGILQDFSNLQLFYHYGGLALILCSTCYITTKADTTTLCMCVLSFGIACLGEIFFFTYLSDIFSHELQNILHPVYDLDWTTYPPKLRKELVILIRRLQKRDILTAGKIMKLDLVFFMRVVQKAYSFYTLINNTKD